MVRIRTPFITFYTTDMGGYYENLAKDLYRQCDRYQIKLFAVKVESSNNWRRNCKMKPSIIMNALDTLGKPFVYLDADTIIHSTPTVFDTFVDIDFAVHHIEEWEEPANRRKGLGIRATPLYFAPTDATKAFVSEWLSECQKVMNDANIPGDHNSLAAMYKKHAPRLRIYNLGLEYSWIRGKNKSKIAPIMELVIARLPEKFVERRK